MFVLRLLAQLKDFNLAEAEALSVEIHEAEVEGYQMTIREDRYWSKLTVKIQEARRSIA